MLHGLQQRADLNRRVALVEFHVSGEGDAARRRVDPGGTEDCLSVAQSRKMSFRSLRVENSVHSNHGPLRSKNRLGRRRFTIIGIGGTR
jgi:hypothetical protein